MSIADHLKELDSVDRKISYFRQQQLKSILAQLRFHFFQQNTKLRFIYKNSPALVTAVQGQTSKLLMRLDFSNSEYINIQILDIYLTRKVIQLFARGFSASLLRYWQNAIAQVTDQLNESVTLTLDDKWFDIEPDKMSRLYLRDRAINRDYDIPECYTFESEQITLADRLDCFKSIYWQNIVWQVIADMALHFDIVPKFGSVSIGDDAVFIRIEAKKFLWLDTELKLPKCKICLSIQMNEEALILIGEGLSYFLYLNLLASLRKQLITSPHINTFDFAKSDWDDFIRQENQTDCIEVEHDLFGDAS